METTPSYTAFDGETKIAAGDLVSVLPVLKARFDRSPAALVLVFEDRSGRQVDFDLRGSLAQVLERAAPPARSGPGRPKLGVISREVSLLPRHWEWLEEQSGGASAVIRRLVDEARKHEPEEQRIRRAIEAAGRFMTAMAGNFPNYEEATRALYARDPAHLSDLIRKWPRDIRDHVLHLIAAG
jgi:hypothetical protein